MATRDEGEDFFLWLNSQDLDYQTILVNMNYDVTLVEVLS